LPLFCSVVISLTIIITRLLIPPPPIPAMARSTNNCTAVCANPQPRSPTAMRARQINSRFLRPKISDNLPLISWNAVEAIRKDVPIQDVAVPVFKSSAMAGVAVETLVWSMKDTNRQTESAGIAILSCFDDMTFLCPLIDSASLSSRGSCSVDDGSAGLSLLELGVMEF
jgi:hypothetical protein